MTGQFQLTEEQLAIQEVAQRFTADNITPHAGEWDEKSHFPRDVIKTSTTTNEGIDELVATIDRLLVEMNREIRAELPYSEGALLNDIHELGAMLNEEFTPSGTLVHARVPPSLYGRLQPYEVSSTAR